MATTAPTDAGRLEMCRAKLAAMGPAAHDMTATQMERRRLLLERISDLEREVAAQLALPVDDLAPAELGLLRPADLEADDTPPGQRHLRLVL